MVIIEMREAAFDKAFELLDEVKELGKQKKMVLCELEDTLYECYESSKDEEEPAAGESELELGYRKRGGMRNYREDDMQMRGYRSRSGMRRSMGNRYTY